MTTTLPTVPDTAEGILDAATGLQPLLRRRAAEIEEAGRLPADVVDALVGAGCFRILLPASHGGAGAHVSAALQLYESLARGDASVGWTAMIGSAVWRDLVGLSRATFDELYRHGPDVPIAGVFNPTGAAVSVDGGHRVSGRWAFASGCTHAAWLYGNCIEEADGGAPRFRTALFRPDEVTIEDTWHVVGLRGTGSNHISVDNLVVPADRTFGTFDAEPSIDAPIARVPMPSLIAVAVASVAVGTARGALDEITGIAGTRTPLLAGSSLASNPLYQHDLARAETEVRAARSLLHEVAGELWDVAVAGGELTLEQRAAVRATAVWVVERSAAVVRTAHQAGGGGAVYLDSPLQRRLRDAHTIAQHFIVRPDTMVTAGAVLAGQGLDAPVF